MRIKRFLLHTAVRLAGPRQLFYRRAPPLRAVWRHGIPALRRLLLLGAVRQQKAALRAPRSLGARATVRGLQCRILSDAYHWALGHAAARLHLSGGAWMGGAQPDLDDRRL